MQRALKAKGKEDENQTAAAAVTVSVRSAGPAAAEKKRKKMKKGESAEDIYKMEVGEPEAKRLRKGMGKERRR